MQIVYPPVNVVLAGSGIFGRTTKEDANSVYEEAKRARLEADALIQQYADFIPETLKQQLYAIDKWFWPNYDQFVKSSGQVSYIGWMTAAETAKKAYEGFIYAANELLTGLGDKIKTTNAPSMPGFDFMDKPFFPGVPVEANPWIIAGAVGLALFIGYKLMTRSK